MMVHQDMQATLQKLSNQLIDNYSNVELFDLECVKKWDTKTRQQYITHLYHARGHFDRQLFQRAALRSSNPADKLKKLEDICDELGIEFIGKNGIYSLLDGENVSIKLYASHEQLFIDFSEDIGCNLENEISSYIQPEYLRQYNETLIKLLVAEDDLTREVAFSAYELLDNIDYELLYKVAIELGASSKGLKFFIIHKESNHFEKTESTLVRFWEKNPIRCTEIINEIFRIQVLMWSNFSNEVLKN